MSIGFAFINEYNQKHGGFVPSMMIGKTMAEILPPEQADFIQGKLKECSKGITVSYPIEMSRPDGSLFNAEQTMVPIKYNDGEIIAYMNIATEVTAVVSAQKRSETINSYQALEASNITPLLKDGLGKGVLKFDYKLEAPDNDTAAASAASYKQIGGMLDSFTKNIGGCVSEISQVLQEFSKENFNVSMNAEYMGDFVIIKDSLKKATESIGMLVCEIHSTTSQLESGTVQMSISTQNLISSFEEQSSTMNSLKEAVTLLTEKTHKNATDAKNASGLSEQVQTVANIGSQHMQDMSLVMEEIKSSLDEIGKVANIIEDIAFQTNLLALNASVEAARAGEHGKGFAVAEEEVRSLAGCTSEATKDTAEMIFKSISRIDEGVLKSAETAEALNKIVEVTSSSTDVISSIATASNEQAQEISRIQQGMEITHKSSADNSSAVQDNASVIEELSCTANMLMTLVDRFKIKKK